MLTTKNNDKNLKNLYLFHCRLVKEYDVFQYLKYHGLVYKVVEILTSDSLDIEFFKTATRATKINLGQTAKLFSYEGSWPDFN